VLFPIGLVVLGVVLLVAGGELILRGSVGLATLLRLTPAVIGLTVVAAGTSVPELAVSGIAASQGPVLALVTLLCVVIAQDGTINRLDAALCLAVYVGFTAFLVSLVRQQVTEAEARELKAEVTELVPAERPRVWTCGGLVVLGIALLGGGAHATVTGAVDLARILGMSERVIGLTIVSIGTGLPEVVASLVSSVRGRSDVAIGNVIGSSLFNILVILGLSAMAAPLPVQPGLVDSDCWWMLGITLLLFPIMYTGRRITRWEGGLLLAVYGVYLGLLLTVSS
jgi:cation:H+ antiporter